MKTKLIVTLLLVILLIDIYCLYIPRTLLTRYPMLTLDKCVEITGYYKVGEQEEATQFVIKREDEEFEKLFAQFYYQTFRRSPRDFLPRGTRYHATEPEDFQWNVSFSYSAVEMPDGSVCSGEILQIQNWYGKLDIHFDDQVEACYVKDQQEWTEKVLEIIQGVKS